MRIIVFGAAGSVGSRIVTEALLRGHEVTAVVRDQAQLSALPARVQRRIGDATSVDQVATLSAGQDLVISATRPAIGKEQELVAAARALLAGTTKSGVRLLLIGGTASLKVPGSGLVVDEPGYVPHYLRDIAVACCAQFEACTANREADWTHMSPPALLVAGERSGRYRLGRDELLFDSDGNSTISIEDFAVAVLDEAESPKHRRSGFTVAEERPSVKENDVMIRTPDGMADCCFVHPTNGAYPGVILWPDSLGLRTSFRKIAKRLAGYGYSVLVINPHYRATAAPIGVDIDGFNTPAGREKVMSLAGAITPDMTIRDATAFAAYLDQQQPVDTKRKLGTIGYCMGGAMAVRTSAKVADRVGAVASFHGRLVTRDASSPHLLVPKTRSSALIAIAGNDDENDPAAKTMLRETYDKIHVSAEIEVYAGTTHGWCVPDAKVYDPSQAERAWSRLLVLFAQALA